MGGESRGIFFTVISGKNVYKGLTIGVDVHDVHCDEIVLNTFLTETNCVVPGTTNFAILR